MNKNVCRNAILFSACLAASVNATAQQLKAPATGILNANRLSHTCSNMNRGNIFREPDGGYHESSQGWFYRAEIHGGTGWAATYCFYGLDMAAPSNRPVYTVHYEMTGYKSNQCTVSGPTVTCSRDLVLKEMKK